MSAVMHDHIERDYMGTTCMYLKWQQLYFSTSVLVGRFIDQYQIILTFLRFETFTLKEKLNVDERLSEWLEFNSIWAVMVKESIAYLRSDLIHGAKRINPFEFDNPLSFPLKPVFLAFKWIVQQLLDGLAWNLVQPFLMPRGWILMTLINVDEHGLCDPDPSFSSFTSRRFTFVVKWA